MACYVLAMTVTFIVLDITLTYSEKLHFSKQYNDYGVLAFQITDFTLMTTSIGILFYLLFKQEKHMGAKEAFRKERALLLSILIVFDLSFVMRALFDDLMLEHLNNSGKIFLNTVLVTFTGLFDFVPIGLILYLHGKNFETIAQEGLALSSRSHTLDQLM